MPLPMVHLSTAIKVCEKLNITPSPELLLGSIAPDAIHMRSNTGREDKKVTHLVDKPELDRFERVKSMLGANKNGKDSDLIKGYCIHLLTDYFWDDIVMPNLYNNILADLPHAEERSLYYLDTDQVDFNLYRSVSWRPSVWKMLREVSSYDIESLLTAEEVSLWRDRVVNWFDKIKQEPKVVPRYITDSIVMEFIDEASSLILEYL